jgi:uncharacterized protein YegL
MKDMTEIAVVIDMSGSMEGLTSETISSFNQFLKEQQDLPGEATMTLTLFNTEYKQFYVNTPIKRVRPLDTSVYKAAGFTALLDAVGSTIDAVGKKLADLSEEERPNKVIVVVITDGDENRSKEYRLEQIKRKIKEQQDKYGWLFVFLGANQDSFKVAGNLGIPAANVQNYQATPGGTRQAYGLTSRAVSSVRGGSGLSGLQIRR